MFVESKEQLGKMLNELNQEGKKDGMRMNKKKTKIMCNEVASFFRNGVFVDGEHKEEVN